jgi:hypothetical protein
MNLMGFDPLDFLNRWQARKVNTFQDYFSTMEPAVRLRLATHRVPDYVLRYPSLLTKPLPASVAGWEITFNWTGIPLAWTPLTDLEAIGLTPNVPKFVDVDTAIERRSRSKSLVVSRRGSWSAGKDLEIVLQQLFELR